MMCSSRGHLGSISISLSTCSWSSTIAKRISAFSSTKPISSAAATGSVEADVRLLDDFFPPGEVGADLLAELLRGVSDRLDAEDGEALAHFRLLQQRHQFPVEPVYHRARRLCRREDADPGVDDE